MQPTDVFLWTIGVIVLIALAILAVRAIRKGNHESKERQRRWDERQAQESQATEEALARLKAHKLVVRVRERDGRRSAFEATLIRQLLACGMRVVFLKEEDGNAIVNDGRADLLQDSTLAIVGTVVSHKKEVGGFEHPDGGWVPQRQGDSTKCDYRLLAAENGILQILGAGCDEAYTGGSALADSIIRDLASMIPQTMRAQ